MENHSMAVSEFHNQIFTSVKGSARQSPEAVRLNTLNREEPIEVSLLLRRKQPLPQGNGTATVVSRESYARKYGMIEEQVAQVIDFAHQYQLSVSGTDHAKRLIHLKGKIENLERAFQVTLSHYRDTRGNLFRGRTGEIFLPASLADFVEGVFGLDNRPAASPKFQVAKKQGRFIYHEASPYSFFPDELARIYGFPTDLSGEGQCIAIIELGGGYRITDLANYFAGLGIPVPKILSISVDGGFNDPSTADSADGEVMLDIEVAGAVAPGATIVVYFAPNTDQGFFSAITTALHDRLHQPSVISISWGAPESGWTKQSLKAYNDVFQTAALLGVTVCAAAGDTGSSDGEKDGLVHVDFPASSPNVVACGGTRLTVQDNVIIGETVWHSSDRSATGGGISEFFELPDYQQTTGIPVSLNNGFKGRGLPDLAGNADPETGYRVLVDGQQLVMGGTSAVAPLMAGLVARLNQQKKGKPLGFIHPKLYHGGFRFRDITVGDNITTPNQKGYKAGVGWDACSGWGVVSGLK